MRTHICFMAHILISVARTLLWPTLMFFFVAQYVRSLFYQWYGSHSSLWISVCGIILCITSLCGIALIYMTLLLYNSNITLCITLWYHYSIIYAIKCMARIKYLWIMASFMIDDSHLKLIFINNDLNILYGSSIVISISMDFVNEYETYISIEITKILSSTSYLYGDPIPKSKFLLLLENQKHYLWKSRRMNLSN